MGTVIVSRIWENLKTAPGLSNNMKSTECFETDI